MTNPKFNRVLDCMRRTHDQKNADYAIDGNPFSNFEEAAASAGVTVDQVFAVLIGIKQARIKALTSQGKAPQNESLQDSIKDLAVYAALRAAYQVEMPDLSAVGQTTDREALYNLYTQGSTVTPFSYIRGIQGDER